MSYSVPPAPSHTAEQSAAVSQALSDPKINRWRGFSRDMGWRGMFYRCHVYRPLMRAIHAFGCCHMEAMPQIEPNERPRFWCHWCGMRGSK